MATHSRTFRTGRLSDKNILDLFEKLERKFSPSTPQFSLMPGTAITRDELDVIVAKDVTSAIISQAVIAIEPNKFNVSFYRGISHREHEPNIREPSPYYDEFVLTLPQTRSQGHEAPTTQEITDCIKIVQDGIQVVEFDQESSGYEPKDLLTNQITSISRVHEKLLSDAIDLHRQAEDERARHKLNNEEEIKQLRQDLDAEYREKQSELDSERISLEEYKKSIDDRAYTYARREDRARITDDIKDRLLIPGLSSSTLRQRARVYFLLAGGIFAAIIAATWTAYEISQITSISAIYWVAVARFSILSSISLGLLIYAVQWARRIYIEDAGAERELERYSYDLNRASWAIETILEAKKENDSQEPPSEWIEGVCRNLFSFKTGNENAEDTSTLGAFSELLKVAAEARVGTDGASIKFNNRGTTKIANSNK